MLGRCNEASAPLSTNMIAMVMFAQRRRWLTRGRGRAMIETWSLLYQLPFGVSMLSHLGLRRWNSNSILGVATCRVLGNVQVLYYEGTLCQRAQTAAANDAHLYRTLLQTLLCIRIQMTFRTPRMGHHSPLICSTRQRIVTTLVEAHHSTASSNGKPHPVLSIAEDRIPMEQLHLLGVSAQFSPVPRKPPT